MIYRLGDRITIFFLKEIVAYVAVVVSVGVINSFEVFKALHRLYLPGR